MVGSEDISVSEKTRFGTIPWKARALVVAFGIVGFYELILAILNVRGADYYALGLMLFLGVVTARVKVRLIAGSMLSLLTAVVLASLMMLGPGAALLVGACGVIVQGAFPIRRMVPHHLAFNLGMITLTVSMAGIGYYWMAPNAQAPLADQFAGAMVAALIYYLGNSVYISTVVSLSGKGVIFRIWHDNFLYTAPSFFVAGALSFAALKLALALHPSVLIAVVPVLYLSYYSYRVYLKSLEDERKHSSDMSDLYTSTLSTLALAIDAKDRNTHGHIRRVQTYSRAIAEAMKLDKTQIEVVAAAALLHDIGKLAIPEQILSKKGPRTPGEMKKMRMHPQIGADIISNIKFPYLVADSILAHHERFDGHGYPNRLAGRNIPLGARILSVADVFDAFLADKDLTDEMIQLAIDTLTEKAGSQFDPEIVTAWTSICRQVVDRSIVRTEQQAENGSTAYTNIQRAASELKVLDTLTEAVASLTSVSEIVTCVCELLQDAIPGGVLVVRMTGNPHGHEYDEVPAACGISIPVVFGGVVLAIISVRSVTDEFTDDDIRLVTTVAEKISGSLHSAIALEVAQNDAMRDKLTGLANRRALESLVESLGGQPCSVVLVDVDAFKAVNDKFGHQAGAAALAQIAAHLRAAFTNVRMICRLGGDEFVVVTSHPIQNVRLQVRQFRKMVRWDPAHEPYLRMRFGVSCGVASSPADGDTVEQILKKADDRMYAFKTRYKQWGAVTAHAGTRPKVLPKKHAAFTAAV